MEWNAENQLKRVLKNGVEEARFSYDPLGRRVEKVAGGVTTSYLYDGRDILRELRGGAISKYIHGPGIDEPLAREEGAGTLTYYHADSLGSIAKQTSQAGTVVHEYRYDAWGNIEAGSTEAGYAFTGRESDPETGLAYYRARYYDPSAGRFLSEDSAAFGTAANLYLYVEADPVGNIDPTGHYTVNTVDKRFNRKIQDAIQKLEDEFVASEGASCCIAEFTKRAVDIFAWLKAGGPPVVSYEKGMPSGTHGYTQEPWQTIVLNYEEVLDNSLCSVAGYVLHEMGHMAREDYAQPADFSKACTFGCIDVGGPHADQKRR